jgi:hypothetical protein
MSPDEALHALGQHISMTHHHPGLAHDGSRAQAQGQASAGALSSLHRDAEQQLEALALLLAELQYSDLPALSAEAENATTTTTAEAIPGKVIHFVGEKVAEEVHLVEAQAKAMEERVLAAAVTFQKVALQQATSVRDQLGAVWRWILEAARQVIQSIQMLLSGHVPGLKTWLGGRGGSSGSGNAGHHRLTQREAWSMARAELEQEAERATVVLGRHSS